MVPGAGDIVVVEAAYVAHMIEVGPDVIEQFKMVQRDMGVSLLSRVRTMNILRSRSVLAVAGSWLSLALPVSVASNHSYGALSLMILLIQRVLLSSLRRLT